MFVFNKTSEWLETLPQEEKEKLLNDGIKEGGEIHVKYRKRLKEISERRKQKLKDRKLFKGKVSTYQRYYILWIMAKPRSS